MRKVPWRGQQILGTATKKNVAMAAGSLRFVLTLVYRLLFKSQFNNDCATNSSPTYNKLDTKFFASRLIHSQKAVDIELAMPLGRAEWSPALT
jgi:hypothetical protein